MLVRIFWKTNGQIMFECVTFQLAGQCYAIDIMRIREVREVEKIRSVPGAGKGFRGVIEIRKKIIPVFDLRRLFEHQPEDQETDFAIIIVKFGKERVGYIVDAVTDIEKISEESLMSAESYTNLAKADFVQSVFSIDDNVTLVINIDKILSVHGAYSDDDVAAA